jgi:diaminobutyrate-2-oxoglutarate transaminase
MPTLHRLGRAFACLWLSETAFDLAAALMGFALGVWVYQQTGSAEAFSLTLLSATVPALLAMPLAGGLADRFDRRWVIAGCDLAAALLVIVLTALIFLDDLTVAHLYVFNALSAVTRALRRPSYQSAVGVIVPKDRLTQAYGLMGFTQALLQIGVPLLAGHLMARAGLEGVMVVELLMVVAGALAVFAALSHVGRALRPQPLALRLPLFAGVKAGHAAAMAYFRAQPAMVALLAYVVLQEGLLALVSTMIAPLVLATHPTHVLGLVLSCGALGAVAGSLLLMVLRVNKRLMLWVLVSDALLSLFVLLAGVADSPLRWCLCAFLALFASSTSAACAGALWMRKTPKAQQGSIFSLVAALGLLAACIVTLLGGVFGERVFEAALATQGAWADGVGLWLGTGKGRGIAFLFVLCGALGTFGSLVALSIPGLRRLDALVGDATDVAAPATAAPAPLPREVAAV